MKIVKENTINEVECIAEISFKVKVVDSIKTHKTNLETLKMEVYLKNFYTVYILK